MMLLGTLTLYGLAFAAGYFVYDLAVRHLLEFLRRGKKQSPSRVSSLRRDGSSHEETHNQDREWHLSTRRRVGDSTPSI
jgi:hypothetical protein